MPIEMKLTNVTTEYTFKIWRQEETTLYVQGTISEAVKYFFLVADPNKNGYEVEIINDSSCAIDFVLSKEIDKILELRRKEQ